MSVKDMPYRLLRAMDILPLSSGSMARESHLSLTACTSLTRDLLHVLKEGLSAIYVPLQGISTRAGQHQALQAIKFLDSIRTGRRGSMAKRAANTLIDMLVQDLVSKRQVSQWQRQLHLCLSSGASSLADLWQEGAHGCQGPVTEWMYSNGQEYSSIKSILVLRVF